MRLHVYLIMLLSLVVMSGCNLGSSDDNTEDPITSVTATPSGKPTVVIDSPQSGSEFVVNDPLFVEATVTDTFGVSSVQLRANGQPVRTIGVEEGNNTTVESLLDYTPRTTGDVTLEVVAFRENGTASDPAQVSVTIRDSQAQVTSTPLPGANDPIINPNDPNCRALVNTNLNFRNGPGTDFGRIRTLAAGEVLQAVGRLADNSWWQLVYRDGSRGWVSAGPLSNPFITLYDGTSILCRNVAITASPPTPTPNVTNTPIPTSTPFVPTQTPIPTDPPTSTPIPQPNLVVSGVFNDDPVTIPNGESEVEVEFSVNVTNNGGPVNEQFSVTARIVGGDTFDVGTFGNLDANQTLNQTITIVFDTTGTQTVIFEVDPEENIDESNENDNLRIVEITVE